MAAQQLISADTRADAHALRVHAPSQASLGNMKLLGREHPQTALHLSMHAYKMTDDVMKKLLRQRHQ